MFVITAIYAAILALMLVALSAHVIMVRNKENVFLGTGEAQPLLRATRAHGNFVEYVPMGLILLGLIEALGGAAWQLHALGLLLVGGRICHFIGVGTAAAPLSLRVGGMLLTFVMLTLAGLRLLAAASGL